jgi:ABC-type antimicrobial peptide transport system permease subunit
VNRFLTLDQLRDRAAWRERFSAVLVTCFTGVALLLAAVGFYATLSYVVTLQHREIGIRIALGASTSAVRRLVASQGLRLAVIGLALGAVAALGLGPLLRSQLFGVTPSDLAAWSAAVALFAAVAVLATFLPARRAALVNPVIALHDE